MTNKLPPKIESLYAFVAEDNGVEGLIAMNVDGVFMPFVAGDDARVDQLKLIVTHLAKKENKKIKLIKLSHRQELETFG